MMTTAPAITRATFVGIPVRLATTVPDAAIWEEVRQKSESTLKIAVRVLDT